MVALVPVRAGGVAVAGATPGEVVVAVGAPIALGTLEALQAATLARRGVTLLRHRPVYVALAQLASLDGVESPGPADAGLAGRALGVGRTHAEAAGRVADVTPLVARGAFL